MKQPEVAIQYKDEIEQYSYSFVKLAGRLGTSVSTADWTTEDSNIITLGTEALSANVATVLITAAATGCAMLKVTATMADGQKFIRQIKINVKELEC